MEEGALRHGKVKWLVFQHVLQLAISNETCVVAIFLMKHCQNQMEMRLPLIQELRSLKVHICCSVFE